MKKIFAIIMAVCMLTSVLCITAVPASAGGDYTVIVCGLGKDGRAWALSINDNLEEAWNEAIYYAINLEEAWNSAIRYESENERPAEEGFVRIVVDFYGDWNADSNGEFGSGIGFQNGAIYVPADAKITVNLGGHSINRSLTGDEKGEAMFIDADADVIISNGTVTGDINSDPKAKLTLDNVYVAGNTAKNSAVYARSASMISEGSSSTIFLIISLVASIVSLTLTLIANKKKKADPTSEDKE